MSGSQRNIQTVIRNLQRRNVRRRQPTVVLEGVRLLEEALAAGVPISRVAASPALERTKRGQNLIQRFAAMEIPVDRLSDQELRALADTETPQGVLAVAEPVAPTLDDVEAARGPILLLDGVQDPGNVGTIIRTAHALGAAGVVLLSGTALPTNPKVVRAAMGSTFHLPVVRGSPDEVGTWLTERGVEIWVADPAGTSIQEVAPGGPVALVVGNEGAGVSQGWRSRAARTVAIPMAISRGVESLNAAAAAAILLYEVGRDR